MNTFFDKMHYRINTYKYLEQITDITNNIVQYVTIIQLKKIKNKTNINEVSNKQSIYTKEIKIYIFRNLLSSLHLNCINCLIINFKIRMLYTNV